MKITNNLIKILYLVLAILLIKPVQGQVNKTVSVVEALRDITQTYKTKFVYESEILRGKTTTASTKKEPGQSMEELLKDILYANDLLFLYVSENHYAIVKKDQRSLTENKGSSTPAAFAGRVYGAITDQDGRPLPGVNVFIRGKSARAVSGVSGNYSIEATKDDIIVFTYVGFKPGEGKANPEGVLNITMDADVHQLQDVEVVSTGYQTLSRERSAGSFSKPDIGVFQNRSSSMSIVQRLDGLVPGLTINNAPGTETMLIRGLTSINGSASPLFVVDGVVLDAENISSLNPNDVEDITVLKDATAASIWGSNAANGVIVITTKKGGNTGKIKIDYDGFINFQGRPQTDYLPVLTSQQFIQAATDIFDPVINTYASVSKYSPTTWKPVPLHEELLYKLNDKINPPTAEQRTAYEKQLHDLANTSNQQQIDDLFYRSGLLTNHTISLRGGSDKYGFYGSAAYTGNQSSTPGRNSNNYKVNLRQDFKFSDRIQMHLITDLTNTTSKSKRAATPNNMFLPYVLFRDGEGDNMSMSWLQLPDGDREKYENLSRLDLSYSPLDEWDSGYTSANAILARINTGLNVKLVKGLQFQGVYGLVKGNTKTKSFDDDQSFTFRKELAQFTKPATGPTANPTYFLPERGAIFDVNNHLQENWNIRNQLMFDDSYDNQRHQISALLGHEIRKTFYTANGSSVRGYDEQLGTSAQLDYNTLAVTGVAGAVLPRGTGNNKIDIKNFTSLEDDIRYISYYGNLGYTYQTKYTINGSWRIDESNLFGKDKSAQNRPVWSVGASWMISGEDFMDNIAWVDRLKVRTTYGVTGNSPRPGSAASHDIFSVQTNAIFPGGRGLILSTPGNRNLSWESTKTLNVGLDFSIFKRLNGSVDVYNKKTEDLIGELQINPFTGFASIEGNQGALRNNGIELNINSLNISNRDFSWRTMLTLGYNKNKVLDLYSKTAITTGSKKVEERFIKGYSAYSIFAYQYAGLNEEGTPQIRLNDGTLSTAKNVATPEDIVYMGTFQPKWAGGFGNDFKYKDFGLQVNAVYNLGFVMRRDVNRFYSGGRLVPNAGSLTTGNVHADFADRWMKKGDEAFTDIPAYNSAKTDPRELNYYYLADKNVVDASYIKLRDITLSYSLPKKLLHTVRADGLSFRLQVSNIMLWKANDYGIDPEFQSAGSGVRNMPGNQGTVTLGAHLTF
ncbi:SusC/RagA family TonB-linked outer membrane protein [Sphingobacterium faecale]|uniref:SusC/RagA family TonB-linked outer membrane protein n=1 Tax=Sphingobacterium faecale TaxID=2803775 RepID=A0ABS1R2Q5_9SPHI|nr:SusC/RagA family TonB-linked outer membrane protein [Sphingobacterium faecale]MBL1408735.1 SusC/RagA family TonB-linked outer membrane protein [Sphingobacterium faecale]